MRVPLAVVLAAGSCGPASAPPGTSAPRVASNVERDETPPPEEPFREGNDPDTPCTMRGRCPADDLPRFDTALSVAGWARLRELANTRAVAVRIDARTVRVAEDCELPGNYVEVVRAPNSPGSAWAATRLVYTPAELGACRTATHAVAAFAIADGADRGAAIAFPLPCTHAGCVGAGLDDAARKAAAKPIWDRAMFSVDVGEPDKALADLVELTALLPGPSSYGALASALEFLTSTEFGGCWWLSEAEVAARGVDSAGRPTLQRELQDCRTRPSLMTCFPERFVPGEGGNCW